MAKSRVMFKLTQGAKDAIVNWRQDTAMQRETIRPKLEISEVIPSITGGVYIYIDVTEESRMKGINNTK